MDTYLALQAARRQAGTLHWQLRDGLSGVASVASVVALVGLQGSCWALMNAFLASPELGVPWLSIAAEKAISALWWNACGLALALAATAGHRYLLDRCDELALEMELVLLELPAVFRLLGGSAQLPEAAAATPVALAERAAQRARRAAVDEFGRRLSGLASIASVAAFVGLFGTCLWITGYTFKSVIGPRSAAYAMVASALCESLLFNAWGLLLAFTATWGYQALVRRRDRLDAELQIAIADLGLALRRPPLGRFSK